MINHKFIIFLHSSNNLYDLSEIHLRTTVWLTEVHSKEHFDFEGHIAVKTVVIHCDWFIGVIQWMWWERQLDQKFETNFSLLDKMGVIVWNAMGKNVP